MGGTITAAMARSGPTPGPVMDRSERVSGARRDLQEGLGTVYFVSLFAHVGEDCVLTAVRTHPQLRCSTVIAHAADLAAFCNLVASNAIGWLILGGSEVLGCTRSSPDRCGDCDCAMTGRLSRR